MAEFRYGPVELYLVGFEGDRPSPATIDALAELLEGGLVRLLDFVIVSKSESGDVEVIEIEDETEEYGFGSIELAEIGITLNVREVPIEEWLASLDASSDYGLNMMWYFSTLGDPAEIPSYLLGVGNPAAYDNPEIMSLLSEVGAESDPSARIDLLIEAETLQAEDAVNIPLWWGQSATAFANDLGMNDYSSFAFISSWPTQLYRAAQ